MRRDTRARYRLLLRQAAAEATHLLKSAENRIRLWRRMTMLHSQMNAMCMVRFIVAH